MYETSFNQISIVKVGIVEDQIFYQRYLTEIIQKELGYEVVVVSKNGLDAVDSCIEAAIDLLILDLRIPKMHGLDAATLILQKLPFLKILAFSGEVSKYNVGLAQSLGILGYLNKSDDVISDDKYLINAIEQVAKGNRIFSPSVELLYREITSNSDAYHKILSPKKIEILKHIGKCMTDQEVGEIMGVTVFAIRKHRSEIMKQLGITSTHALIRYAQQLGLANKPIDEEYDQNTDG